MDQRRELALHAFDEARVTMANRGDGYSSAKIEVAFPIFVPDIDAFAALETKVESGVGRDDITLIELPRWKE